MAVYRITAPDGSEFDVTAPDTATEAEVMAYAQQQFAQQAQAAPRSADDPSLWAGGRVPSIDPTDGTTNAQRFVAGYGGALPGLARGGRQLVTEGAQRAFEAVGLPSAGLAAEASRLRQQSDEIRALEAPLMDTSAGFWGSLTGNAAPMLAAPNLTLAHAGRAAPYVNAAIQGGMFGALQPVGAEDSRASNVGLGAGLGVLGQGIAQGASGLARGAVSRLDSASQGLARMASDAGMRLGLGQISQNPAVRTIVSQMERLPFSGATGRNTANQETFNELVAGTFGASGKKVDTETFAAAKRALQDRFEELSSRNDLAPTPELMAQLRGLSDEASRLAGSDTARMVNGWIKELVGKAGPDGTIPGKAYQSFDSRLGSVLKSGGEPAHYLGQLRSAVRSAMDDSISPADKAAWQQVRQRYGALKMVEPLVAKSATGDISPAALLGRTTADNAGKARMASGRGGELGSLARIGQRFLKDAPNSGTADRLMVNLGVGGALWGSQQAGVISPETALWTAGILAGNRAALKAINSRALVQGGSKPLQGLARLAQPAPRLLPAAAATLGVSRANDGTLDIGTVTGYDANDPRLRY